MIARAACRDSSEMWLDADTTFRPIDLRCARMHQLGKHPAAGVVHGGRQPLVAVHHRFVRVEQHEPRVRTLEGATGVAPVICMANPLRARSRW